MRPSLSVCRLVIALILGAPSVAVAHGELTADRTPETAPDAYQWEVVETCRTDGRESFGQGQYKVSVAFEGEYGYIRVQGCGAHSVFQVFLKQRGDLFLQDVYVLPLFTPDSRDILIHSGDEEGTWYHFYAQENGYTQTLYFETRQKALFDDDDGDGRWEIIASMVTKFECANGGASLGRRETPGEVVRISADTICQPAAP